MKLSTSIVLLGSTVGISIWLMARHKEEFNKILSTMCDKADQTIQKFKDCVCEKNCNCKNESE